MAKIHTHYDNLKVARQAPQEVIRAAYKALSQKYHPDKNPGDEKAARIMAIVNTAYNVLSDPVRRKEHDAWIAAEEWEVDWLESTRGEDGRAEADGGAPRGRARLLRDPRWWLGLGGCFLAGGVCMLLALQPGLLLPSALAVPARAVPHASLAARTPAAEAWPMPAVAEAAPSPVKALAVTQLVVPSRVPDCDSDLAGPAAPNGEPWPAQSGYLAGYPVGNQGEEMQVVVDNGANPLPVLVRIYDLERRANVRHAYVLAHGKLTIDKLAAGKYEVRYQQVTAAFPRPDCAAHRTAARLSGAAFPAV